MRSLQRALTDRSLCYRLLSGSLAECSSAGTCAATERGIATTAAAGRFRPVSSTRPVEPIATGEEGRPILPEPKKDLVEKFLGPGIMCSFEQRRERIRGAIRKFERFPGDTGSSEVQVGILTEKILCMAEHMREHRKDYSSRDGLRGMLAQRRKLLQYLRRADFDAYACMLSSLGLKDTYAKQDRLAIRRTRGIDS